MSLRRRLNRGLTIILSLVFFAHWLAADWVIRSVAEKQMLTRLMHDSDSLLDTLKLAADGQLTFDSFHIGSVYGQAFSGHYFLIHIDDRAYSSVSLQGRALAIGPAPGLSTLIYHFADGPKQQPLLVFSRGYERFGHHISISIAEDLTDIGHDINAIRLAYFLLSILVLIIAISLQSNDVKRVLQSLNAIRDELADIANGQQQQISAEVPAEIKPLVKETNRLLLLVERRLNQSRTAIGNLAHALKTPLAMLYRLAEDPVLQEHPALQEQIQQQNLAIHQRIEHELKRARISGNIQAGSSFNPYREIGALAKLLKNIYYEKHLQITIDAPDRLIPYDREDMLELIGNLVDNACKWANQQILIQLRMQPVMMISVGDDGPGCSESDMQQLVQRGVRLDEAVHGHGLGLAIVRDIAESYRGLLHINRSERLGGLLVTVTFPG